MYEGIVRHENGTTELKEFESYGELCLWLASHPLAGVVAYLDGVAIDQGQLQADLQAL